MTDFKLTYSNGHSFMRGAESAATLLEIDTDLILSIVREDQVLVSPQAFYEESERRAQHCCGVEEDATKTHHCISCCQLVQQETLLEELEGEGVKP